MPLTNDQIQDIIQQYTSGTAPSIIGAQYGMYSNSVTRIIRKNGIERNQHGKVLSQDERKQAVEDYINGISSEIIARNLNVDAGVIRRELKKNNVQIRPATENKRKYKIDENYFEVIDTQEKAYFLGILYADGSLSSKGNDVSLGLKEYDHELLVRLSNIVYGFEHLSYEDRQVNDTTLTRYYTLRWCSQKIHRDLCKCGCGPSKTFDIRFPNFLSRELLQHFIRGYFDGDGCISVKESSNRPVVDITSNHHFVFQMHNYINSHLNIRTAKANRHYNDTDRSSGNFQITATPEVIKFMDYLYKDATIYMQRKYDIYQKFLKNQIVKKSKKAQKTNDPSKYGTSYIATYNDNQLTTEYVQSFSADQKNDAANEIFAFYRQNGFPYPISTKDELIRDFSILRDTDVSQFVQSKKSHIGYRNHETIQSQMGALGIIVVHQFFQTHSLDFLIQ